MTLASTKAKTAPGRRDERGRIDLKSFDRAGLEGWMADTLGETPLRAQRVYQALWQQGARSFAEMTGVARALRERLEEVAWISFLEPELIQRSSDGTLKYLWKLHDGRTIESVLIPDGDRVTLCMSSQVGCAMACTFCLTGDIGLQRHLQPAEIANQALQVNQQLPEGQRVTNLVYMGQGEPLHNLDNLVVALNICLDDLALNFSHRRVTVSTVGLVPKLKELTSRVPVNLAISLNASSEEARRAIMPITRKYSLAMLLQACRDLDLAARKRITFEYVMFRDDNDSLDDAGRVYDLLKDVRAKVNLIPYNENPGREHLLRPPEERVRAFQKFLMDRGMNCTVRATRGRDISAACGQLGNRRSEVDDEAFLAAARRIAGLPEAATGGRTPSREV